MRGPGHLLQEVPRAAWYENMTETLCSQNPDVRLESIVTSPLDYLQA